MPGERHYREARERMLAALRRDLNPRRMRNLGAETEDGSLIRLPALRWTLRLQPEPYEARVLPEERPVRLKWQVLALDYLRSLIPPPAGELVSFTDFPELRNYREPFEGRVIRRLEGGVAASEDGLDRAVRACGGERQEQGPSTYDFRFFPLLTLRLVRHPG